jgi:ATP-binding cassette subfamily C protein
MLCCLLVGGVLEGVGIMTIIPILNLVIGGDKNSLVQQTVEMLLGYFSLEPTLLTLLLIISSIMVAKAGLNMIAMAQVGYTVANVGTHLRLQLVDALMKARWQYFVRQPVGMMANALSTEATRASQTYRAACMVVSLAIQVVVYVCVAFTVSFEITLAAIAVGGILVLGVAKLVKMTRSAGNAQTEIMKNMLTRFADGLYNIKPLKAMALEDRLTPLLKSETQSFNSALKKVVLSEEATHSLQEPVLVVFLCAGLYIALSTWDIPFANLMLMAVLFQRIVTRVGTMQMAYQRMTASESAYWSILQSIHEAKAQCEDSAGSITPAFSRGMELCGVGFAYGQTTVFQKVDMSLPTSGMVSLVGPSGSGKTTLLDLVTGLLRPQAGRLLLDGESLEAYDIHKWRGLVGYVPQELSLFNDTICNNITLGDPRLSAEEAQEALKKAGAWDFVAKLPDGIDTQIGERGAALSGGQRQRIAVARALVRQPKLLILDEATSALDPETEAEIARTVRELARKICVLTVSHRPALVEFADKAYALQNGRLHLLDHTDLGNSHGLENI